MRGGVRVRRCHELAPTGGPGGHRRVDRQSISLDVKFEVTKEE